MPGPTPTAGPAPSAVPAPTAPPQARPDAARRPRRSGGPLGRARLTAARLYSRVLMRRPPADWSVPIADGRYGPAEPADDRPLTLLMLGDSLAQSLGAGRREETLGARLADGLGRRLDRPVDLRVLARVGATTAGLRRQVARAARLRPGLAVLIVGGNDALLPLPLGRSGRGFAHLLGVLHETGWQLVVVPCPDPGYAPGLRSPARWWGARRSRRLARLQSRAAERVGAVPAPSSGTEFRDRAHELLGPDGVHPSPRGYAEHAERMLPSLLEAARRPDRVETDHAGTAGTAGTAGVAEPAAATG
ncbi:SGNH/GDSL hydrolase family protein [Kitasatospora sp. NPDC058218]|uniref:SGNH/GDSL hydrolase family protein n=1 Tax=Kitasatospora sp. NPDC058218 TaxID=3346385 RepID=UPI0036DD87F4